MTRRSNRRWLPVAVLAVVAGTLLAGPAGARTEETAAKPNPLAALIAKSKKESGLVFYANAPAANLKVVTDRFQSQYSWMKSTSYDLDNNVIFSKYASEAAQGTRTADLLISSAPNLWVYATRQKYLANYDPIELNAFPKFAKQYKGVFIISPDPAVLMYNKLLLKDKVPASLTQIANDPGTYGKLTGYTVDNLFGYTGLWGYVQKKGWGNLQKIGKDRFRAQTGVAGQQSLVSQGAAVVAYLTSPTVRLNIKNSPQLSKILDWTYNKDATPLVPRGMGVTAKAKSPASAKLFLNWIYSKAGQQAMCDAGFTAFRTGFKPRNCTNTLADVYAKVGRKNVILVPFSQKFVNDYPRFKARWHGIFG
ncbi:MAG TPA: extracellular solute-binding protein [Gaiellaceae bacterium]|jgi:iron(III) transport system substrate-binding protein|nr:extracellular solute-binding protein [Gaiellaceae bacterium]